MSAKLLKIGVILLLLAPLIIQVFKLKEPYPLHGVQVNKAEHYADSLNGSENYFDGTWQQLKTYQLQENLLIRNLSIKFRNQMDFSLFNKVNAQHMYYYGDQFFRFYCVDYHEGYLFMGEDEIKEKVQKIKSITAALGDSIPVITAIAPKKAHLYKELLPEFNTLETEYSNYRYIKKTLIENDLPCIDYNQWFMDIHENSEAPLMGSGGVHWSRYGATIAMDSLISYLNKLTNKNFQNPQWEFTEDSVPNYHDNDAVNLSNLKYPPYDQNLKGIEYIENNSDKQKVKALVISDSFFDVISLYGLRENIFTEDTKYDYYYGTQPGILSHNQHLEEEDFVEYIQSVDCIIIMSDVVNLENYSWGFIDDAYEQLVTDRESH